MEFLALHVERNIIDDSYAKLFVGRALDVFRRYNPIKPELL